MNADSMVAKLLTLIAIPQVNTLPYQHYPNHRPTYIVSLYFTIPALS